MRIFMTQQFTLAFDKKKKKFVEAPQSSSVSHSAHKPLSNFRRFPLKD